jgi:hypothetical protein
MKARLSRGEDARKARRRGYSLAGRYTNANRAYMTVAGNMRADAMLFSLDHLVCEGMRL